MIDSNIFVDIFTKNPSWYAWSSEAVSSCADAGIIAINPIIYAELCVPFAAMEDLDRALGFAEIHRLPLPWDAAFLAGKAHLKYKRGGGTRTSPLPDFYIGAHAAVSGLQLLTRDAKRFRNYFPKLKMIGPD